MQPEEKYGYLGWKEFVENRKELLNEFYSLLRKNSNRPVRTSHGKAGEAIVRKWLAEFLPQRYGVTSGYIIPDIICSSYKLYHYDVIIYDKLNSPVLWIEGNYDDSHQGKKKAIPAKYIFSVIEIKATFSNDSVKDALSKLSELNELSEHLPKEFSSCTMFFQIKNEALTKTNILNNFIGQRPFKFWGGIIVRSELNDDMTGLLTMMHREEKKDDAENELDLPLAKDIEALDIYSDEKGNIKIAEPGAGIRAFVGHDKRYHFNKVYSCRKEKDNYQIRLSWSYNRFSEFVIFLLGFLEGKDFKSTNQAVFGQVFDLIQRKKDK